MAMASERLHAAAQLQLVVPPHPLHGAIVASVCMHGPAQGHVKIGCSRCGPGTACWACGMTWQHPMKSVCSDRLSSMLAQLQGLQLSCRLQLAAGTWPS